MPYPLPLTRTEAYLAYKAGVIQQSDLKPSLAVPRNGIDAWLAYWTGLAADYPKREDGTPHILQEEEAYIAYLSGVINEYPEKCLHRVGEYLRYLISARWGRPDHPLNREELYLSLIKTQVIPSGDPSSDITIDGTAKAPFVDVKMYGDTFQQTYTGKNLLNYNTIVQTTLNGVTLSIADDGTITLNGTCSSDNTRFAFDGLSLALDGTYTLSSEVISGTITNATDMTKIRLFKSGYSGGIRVDLANTSASSTSSASGDYTLNDIRIDNGVVLTNYKIKIQLEKSATATSFEPYVGGIPSPNPDYPQQIQTVTGLQTVEIHGKNLLRYPYTGGTIGTGLTWTVADDGTIHVVGTIGGGNKSYYLYNRSQSEFDMPEIPAGTYKVFWSITGSGSSPRITIQDANGYHNSNASNEVTIATSAKPTNIYIQFIGSQSGDVDLYIKPMIVPSDQADVYAPYSHQTLPLDLGTIELCKLGAYQDYIWKDGEDWKVHKKITKYVCDSTPDWTWDASVPRLSASSATLGLHVRGPSNADTAVIGKSNKFVANSFNYVYTQKNNGFAYSQSGFISCVDKEWGSESEAKADILGSIFYFVLRDAYTTDITITDTTLIEQLEALKNGGAEDGTTYIKVNATDPNLPGLLYVEAPKYE